MPIATETFTRRQALAGLGVGAAALVLPGCATTSRASTTADPAALLARHVARVNHVHCKDVRRPVLERAWAEDMSFMGAVLEGIFTVPGDGLVDYPPLLRQLHDAGYAGWIVVEAEQDPAKAHPLTDATMGYRNLRQMAEAAGFTIEN